MFPGPGVRRPAAHPSGAPPGRAGGALGGADARKYLRSGIVLCHDGWAPQDGCRCWFVPWPMGVIRVLPLGGQVVRSPLLVDVALGLSDRLRCAQWVRELGACGG